MKIESARGTMKFSPKEKILRDEVMSKLTGVFEKYGYAPLETSMIERLEVLTTKFAGGQGTDVSKEIFKFKDQGKRNLGLRFDLTVPLARFVAKTPNMKLPFKRYEIGRVYRDGPIKLGRCREFWQCDADIVGVKDVEAEAELILLALDTFKELNLDAFIEVNDRNILYEILESFKVKKQDDAIIIIDKLKKVGEKEVESQLKKIGVKNGKDIIKTLKDEKKIKKIADTTSIDKLLKLVNNKNVKFTPTLARGLAYYTGIVFEGFLKNSKIKSSICGGGRYDKLIGLYGSKDLSATGISFGVEPICESLKKEEKQTLTKVFVIPIQTFEKSLKLTQKLRDKGINTEIDLTGRGISKNLDYANAKNIPFVIFLGDEEIKKGVVKLKDMKSGKEKELSVDKAIGFLT
ncbi:histidine--tRNA ligase [Candidatus Woesearchaeota archaeon]|nr:histidine--tRNA ligase [Candidatus Woesearchaeota archaeon]